MIALVMGLDLFGVYLVYQQKPYQKIISNIEQCKINLFIFWFILS
jgi:hypothetical protein